MNHKWKNWDCKVFKRKNNLEKCCSICDYELKKKRNEITNGGVDVLVSGNSLVCVVKKSHLQFLYLQEENIMKKIKVNKKNKEASNLFKVN